jgi:NodT family efflux transporter outer membrane factor (OMF) lipoprotein
MRRLPLYPRLRVLFSAAALTGLAGCAVGPDYQPPAAPQRGSAVPAGLSSGAQHLDPRAAVNLRWWKGFNSPPLDTLIDTALKDSPDLEAAEQRLTQAQAQLAAAQGGNWPQLDASINARRERSSGATFGSSAAGGNIFNVVTGQLTVGYTPDVFGGQRRKVESAAAAAQLAHEEARAAYLSLLGNLVSQGIAEAGLRSQIQATKDIIDLRGQAVGIVSNRVDAGAAQYSDLLDARSRLAASRATLPGLESALARTRDRLRSLAGHLPGDRLAGPILLDRLDLPEKLPYSVPSKLVRQRPDIRAAESRLHRASAEVGIATANLYPQFTLTASWGRAGSSAGEAFGSGGESIWNLGLNLLAPLLHGGTLHAEKRAAVAAYKAALADYNRTTLNAFADVADVLHGLDADNAAMGDRREAMQSADEAQKVVAARYKAGGAGYLEVINAQAQYLQTRIDFINARVQRLQDTAALYVALGGGWWNGTDNRVASADKGDTQ